MQCTCRTHTHTKKQKHMHECRSSTGVLYLHHPLKHVGQREEGDEHIFTGGLQYALDDNIGPEEEEEDGMKMGGTQE